MSSPAAADAPAADQGPVTKEAGGLPLPPKFETMVLMGLLGLCFIFVVVGTPITVYDTKVNIFGFSVIKIEATMWEIKAGPTKIKVSEFDCGTTKSNFQAMEAFALLSIFTITAALALSILDFIGIKLPLPEMIAPWLAAGAAAVAWLFILLTWTIIAGTFEARQCGAPSLKAQGYKMKGGFALFLVSWLLLTLGLPAYGFLKMKALGKL